MFQNESDLKKLIDRLNIDTEPSPNHRENLRQQMLSAFGEERLPRPLGTPATGAWRTITQTIVKSKITKLAAAAVVITAVVAGLHHYAGPIDFAAPAFGDVIKNMQQMKWIYFFKEDLQEGTIKQQIWACPDAQILIGKGDNRWVVLLDCKANRKCVYDAQERSITVSYMEEDYAGMYRMYVSSPLRLMDEIIDRHTREEAYITRGKARYNGKDAVVYRFEIPLSENVVEQSQWVVDAQTHLPIINEVVRVKADGSVQRSHRFAFDYPETGPQSIYDLGVPRSATIIDKAPKPDVEEILKTYHNYKDKTLKRYIAIISVHNKPEYIEYSDEAHRRVERYDLTINGSDWTRRRDFYLQQMGDTFDSVFRWLKNTDVMCCAGIELHDGIFYYEIDAGDTRDGKPPSRGREYSLPGHLVHLGWPRIEFEGNIVENNYSRENGLICIEQEYNRYYIDPNRDYICQRSGNREVVEFGRTDSGHWYPRKVSDGTTIYLNEDPEFPEGIFEPRSLPGYVEWQKEDVPVRKPSLDSDEVQEYEGFTPLHMAVFIGNMDSAKRLLTEGADVNPEFNSGGTPMELAAAAGRLDMVKLLFEHGAGFTSRDDRCALAAAVEGGNLDVLKFMLDNGADINGLYKRGKTALHYAAEKARTECVRMLLEYGADVENRDKRGETALLTGVERARFIYRREDCVETARLLLEAGADVDTLGQDGRTPLSLLCLEVSLSSPVQPNIELIKLLVERGADVNFHLPGEGTSLINAVRAKNLEVVKILLEAGADPFVEEHPLWPSLIVADIAALNGCEEIEQLLRKHMEPEVSANNREIRIVVTSLLQAIRDGNYQDALKYVDVECSYQRWEKWPKRIHDDYAGQYKLFDEILSIRAQSDWAEVIIRRPKSDKEKYLVLGLMQYPDNSWKVLGRRNTSFDLKKLMQGVPARGLRLDLDDYREALFKAAGKAID